MSIMSIIAEMMKSTIRAHVLAARRELGAEATARDVAELALQRSASTTPRGSTCARS